MPSNEEDPSAATRGQHHNDPHPYLTVEEAASRLCIKRNTLDKWRQMGRGPTFREHGGRIVYHIDELDAWSASKRRNLARKYRRSSDTSSTKGGA